jgi:hypothetical protein
LLALKRENIITEIKNPENKREIRRDVWLVFRRMARRVSEEQEDDDRDEE